MLRIFQQTYHIPGTLAANILPVYAMPCDAQLLHVSFSNSAASDAQLKIGTTVADAAYMAFKDVGDSDVPAEYGREDFVGAQFPHIPKGTLVKLTLDFDGNAGVAAANATVVLTFAEG